MDHLYAKIPCSAALHILTADHPCPAHPHDAMGHHGGGHDACHAEGAVEQEAEGQIGDGGAHHKPLVLLKMPQHRAVGTHHAVVPAHIFVEAEHHHKAQRQQAAGTHPERHKGLEQAQIGGGHKAAKKVAEEVKAPEHLFVMVVGGGGLVVDNIADGGGKAVHDFVADVGGAVRDGGVVAQVGGLDAAAQAGGHDGVRRAIDGVGQAMDQKIPQVVENPQFLEILEGNFYVMDIGKVLFEPPGDDKVGAGVEHDTHAKIQHIVGRPQRDGNFGQIGGDIEAQVNAGTDVPLLGAGVHEPPGDQKIAGQGGQRVEAIHRVGGSPVHLGHDPGQRRRPHRSQKADDQTHGAVGPLVHGHILADFFGVPGGDLLIEAVADDTAHTQLGDREKVEELFHHLGGGGNVVAEMKDQQPPGHKAQNQQQHAGPQRIGQIQNSFFGTQRRILLIFDENYPLSRPAAQRAKRGPNSLSSQRKSTQSARPWHCVPLS